MPLLSNSAESRFRTSLEEEAIRRVRDRQAETFLFVLPNRIAQRRLRKELIRSSAGVALPDLNILTLADLAGKLGEAALPGYERISDAKSAVLVELSIRELLEQRKLKFFERAAASDLDQSGRSFPIPRGTFELVVNTIRQLKESGVAPQHVARDVAKIGASKGETTEGRRASDILAIYERYQAKLVAHDLMDTYGQVLLINERYASGDAALAAQDFRKGHPKVTDVFVSGFFYLEEPSIEMIAQLARIPSLRWHIALEKALDNTEVFEGLLELERKLAGAGFKVVAKEAVASVSGYAGKKSREYLGSRLFQDEAELADKVDIAGIHYCKASTIVQEVEDIAKRIKLIYERDPEVREDLSRILVAMPSVEAYTPILQEVFRRNGIPVEISDRYHLDRSPLVMALLSLLEMARTGLRRQELSRLLRSPYLDFRRTDGGRIDPDNLLSVLLRYRPTGDVQAWKWSLAGQVKRLAMEMEESEEPLEHERLSAEQRRLSEAIEDLDRLATILQPLHKELSPREFLDAFHKLMVDLGVRNQLLANNSALLKVGALELDLRAYEAFLNVVEELAMLLQVMDMQNEKRKIEFYQQRLKAALMVQRFNVRPIPKAVLVTSTAQSISQPADYLFLAGLVEGALPSPYQPQVFLPESLQRGEQKQRLEERVLFYQAITNFSKELYLSHPCRSAEGSEVTRSSFLDALEEIVTLNAAEPLGGIFSYNDLLKNAGNETLHAVLEAHPSDPHVQMLQSFVPRARESVVLRQREEDTIYRGTVDPVELTEAEREALEYNRTRVWSITQLERYARCPFRYFAQDILALGEQAETDEGLDPRDRGSILHEILRDFLLTRKERGAKSLRDLSEPEMGEVYAEAQRIAEAKFSEKESDHPFWRLDRDRLLSGVDGGENVITKFIKQEKEISQYAPRPTFFEVSFGGIGRAPNSPIDPVLSRDEPVMIEGLKLRGKIDRLDVPDTQSEEPGAYTVIDYKSGKMTASFKDMVEGRSLQLPLYLKVAEDLLRTWDERAYKGVAALYHKLLDPESKRDLGLALKEYCGAAFEEMKRKKNGLFESEEALAQFIDDTVAKAKTYVEQISDGRFPLITADHLQECNYCPYGAVCRVREAEDAGVLR